MNIDKFVKEFIIEFKTYQDYYNDFDDLLDATIDDIVCNNTIEENKEIIIKYSGDIYNALNLYKIHLGNIEVIMNNIDCFYQQLAFISLFKEIYPIIYNSLNNFNSSYYLDEIKFINDFVEEYSNHRDSYADIIELLDTILDDYVYNNSIFLNKQIVIDNCNNIENAIYLYIKHLGNLEYKSLEHLYERLAFVILFIKLYPKIIDEII
jgi:hypothetical protein